MSIKCLSAKFGFTPPPPKRAQNEEKLYKSIEDPQIDTFLGGERYLMDKTILWASERFWMIRRVFIHFYHRKKKSTRKNPPKLEKFIWTSFSEQFPLGPWSVSRGRWQKFARTFRKSSCKRGVFLVFRDLGWVLGPLFIQKAADIWKKNVWDLQAFFPDISFWTANFPRKWRERWQKPDLPDLAWNSQTSFSQTSATTGLWTKRFDGHLGVSELIRDAETKRLVKFAFWRGLGRGKIYGKLSPKHCFFPGKYHDSKIWKFCEFYCQEFCCHLGSSKLHRDVMYIYIYTLLWLQYIVFCTSPSSADSIPKWTPQSSGQHLMSFPCHAVRVARLQNEVGPKSFFLFEARIFSRKLLSRAAKRGGFKPGGFPDLDLSFLFFFFPFFYFFVFLFFLFCPFLSCPKFFFVRGTNFLTKIALSWSAANGGLRDGGLSKSEDIWGKRPFSSVFWIFAGALRTLRKRAKKAEKGRKRPISADFQEGRPGTP